MAKLKLDTEHEGNKRSVVCEVPDSVVFSHGPTSVEVAVDLHRVTGEGLAKLWEKVKRYGTDGVDQKKQTTPTMVQEYLQGKADGLMGLKPLTAARVTDPVAREFKSLILDWAKAKEKKLKNLGTTVDSMTAVAKAAGAKPAGLKKALTFAKKRAAERESSSDLGL